MHWKSILSAILVATTATAQTVHHLPFASQGNTIELAVANTSGTRIADVGVRIENAPPWLVFAQKEQSISSIAAGEEQLVMFVFTVDKFAPIGQEQGIRFAIIASTGQTWIKQITVAVAAPETFELFQNYPNPFNPTTTISYQLPGGGTRHNVSLRVYNLLGQEVVTLVDGEQQAGYQQVTFDAGKLATGVYIYQIQLTSLRGENKQLRRTMLLLK